MSTVIVPESMYFGAPTSLTVGGVEVGGTLDAPKVSFEIVKVTPEFKNAKGPVKGTVIVKKVVPSIEFTVNELTAAKIAWAMPGVVATTGTAGTHADGHSVTLPADVAAGASVIKFTGIALADPSAESDDIIDTATAHGFVAGQRVMFESKTGGTGLSLATPYFVIAANLGATTLQLSLTAGGAAINFTTDITAGVLIPAFTVGEFLKVGDTGEQEVREISAVGTSGTGGTGLTFTLPFLIAHDTGDAVLEVDDAGSTLLTWTPGRVPSASYRDVEAIGPGLDGRTMRVLIQNALSAENLEIPLDDDNMAGVAVKMVGHYAPGTPTVAPFEIELL